MRVRVSNQKEGKMFYPVSDTPSAAKAGEKDITAPGIPENLAEDELTGTDFTDDEVISEHRSAGTFIEDVSADHISLERSVFEGCTFRNVSFRGIDMKDVRFTDCNLSNVDFGRAIIHKTVFSGCNLTGIDLREATFRSVVFENCIARYSFFRSSDFDRAAFRSCRLENADFQQTGLTRMFFSMSNLTQIQLSGTPLKGIDLCTCNIDGLGARMEDLTGAVVSPAQAVELAKMMGVIVKM